MFAYERKGLEMKKKFKVPRGYRLSILDDGAYNKDQQYPEWYVSGYGSELIAAVSKDDNEAKIYCCGEMRLEWGEFSLRHTSAILKETEFKTDKELEAAINREEIIVENNPWFITEINGEDYDLITFDIQDAINAGVERLIELEKEDANA